MTKRPEVTARGCPRFRCRDCGRQFNERSGGTLNRTCLPSRIIAFVVFCRLRYRLTLRDLSEILLLRGIKVSHGVVRDWETKPLPVMGEELRKRCCGRQSGPGASWYLDETYPKVRGKWAYLYRAVDWDGNLIDAMLSGHRDMAATKAFFRLAKTTTGVRPDRVTTDGYGSYPKAIRTVLGRAVRHRTRHTLTTDLSRTTVASRSGSDARGASSPIRPPRVSAVNTANCVISFAAVVATTS